jgi:hypothetical protein
VWNKTNKKEGNAMKSKMVFLILACYFIVIYGKDFTDKHSQEIGGMISISIENDSARQINNKYYIVDIKPFYHFFISKYIYLGPIISYNFEEWQGNQAQDIRNKFGFGFDAGIAFRTNTILIPFGQLNYTYVYVLGKSIDLGNIYNWNEYYNSFAIDIGVKIPMFKHASINIASGYTYYAGQSSEGPSPKFNTSIFRIMNIGLSALIF